MFNKNNEIPEDLVYGRNPVLEALRHKRPIARVWMLNGLADHISREVVATCKERNIPFKFVDKTYLDQVTLNAMHQGLVAKAAPKEYVDFEVMVQKAEEKNEAPLILILDEVEDPHNLGAAIRSVDALGAHGVIIPKNRAVPLTASVSRTSAGALEYVDVSRVTNLNQTIDKLKDKGLWVYGASAEAKKSIYEVDWTGAIALVVGGEDKGISQLVEKNCDELVSIPMSGHVNSLNVSASVAIILSEIKRQRLSK